MMKVIPFPWLHVNRNKGHLKPSYPSGYSSIGLVFSSETLIPSRMPITPVTIQVPLVTDAHGVVRVSGTRVTLDSIVGAFRSGATAEEIAQQFPTLALADIYEVIAYYLRHTAGVDAYLAGRQTEAESLRGEMESRFDPRGLRARLLARRTAPAI